VRNQKTLGVAQCNLHKHQRCEIKQQWVQLIVQPFAKKMKNILVIGATGMLGKTVTNTFIEAGFSVTIMARNVAKAEREFPKATVIFGDLKDKESIKNALQNQEAIYLSLSIKQDEKPNEFHTEQEGLNNLLEIAKSLNIRRLAYLSSLVMNYQGMNNFDWWVFRIKQEAVQKIKNSGIPYTIFYPSTFMESVAFQSKQGKMVALAGTSNVPLYYIAAEDFAKQVAKSFQVLTNENRDYIVQGTEALTQDEAAKVFVKNYKKERLFAMKMPIELMKFLGKFSQKMNYGYNIITALNNYPEKFAAQQTWEELGNPEITLEEFSGNL
jgi:uncharacterized protein YbjT (DUF2867 family)